MIKQDYLIRMIQEIISLLVEILLFRKKIPAHSWVEYDSLTRQILGVESSELPEMCPEEILSRYAEDDPVRFGKIELAAMTMLKIADEGKLGTVNRAKLEQDARVLLLYVQEHSPEYSFQRKRVISMLDARYSL